MPTLQELIEKVCEESPNLSSENILFMTKGDMEEFGKACYMEGVNSGKPWGGSKEDHYDKFIGDTLKESGE